ncbi:MULTISPECIES: mannose-1-phosphate guanylyltransferase [unclassified Candidatus Frackibacter]|uniref:mannose-1-phosphate guanylyltransferase n=1 Tax=unclassified Candidatus Frackibacter TaxID=2648818 RepID=UPI000791990D|nr:MULTISPECIES: mannose-1-phosphate guanylyltransferase [unclassified Candidatus Frackibacter]KXS45507.1 MAG: mannose-1-phosphate guanylyltransferase [Candidatus Frackibacter sp. T328-2]SDC81932.1 mannose-1-phosphate guanylyltransferase [Candidatus Frackibacter sp. WG11]SEM96369.1 mannose-1-phosphate guanylyltransferase [Candidatus Frackibacter sp. WG12]SFM04037.1 mannose-1-phosphate guanylyltransferase [Candidatus Frackibacter sp. WG13]
MITPLIMAGGIGSRFWPLSRKDRPKQFLNLVDDDKSMIQATVDRISRLTDEESIFIATNQDYATAIQKQLPTLAEDNIIVEPMGKNTAACIGLAAIYIEQEYPDAVMVVLPSDHLIKDEVTYLKLVEKAAEVAKSGENLVTIGIEPTHPETGYGYIHYDQDSVQGKDENIFKVNEFTEKPDRKRAEEFLQAGNYLWNSGMFLWKVSTIRKMFKEYMPKLDQSLEKMKRAIGTEDEFVVLTEEFEKLDSISIDYGIMEKADNIYVLPGDFGWDDVGSWPALERLKELDKYNNLIKGEHIGIETKNSIIHGNGKLITTVGLDDVVIVDTEDALLICDKKKAQEIKELRRKLAEAGFEDCL